MYKTLLTFALVLFFTSCASVTHQGLVGRWEASNNQKYYQITIGENGDGFSIVKNGSGKVLVERPLTWRKTIKGIEVSEFIGTELESAFHVYFINLNKTKKEMYLSTDKYKFNYYRAI